MVRVLIIAAAVLLLAVPPSWGQNFGPNDTYENNPILREAYENIQKEKQGCRDALQAWQESQREWRQELKREEQEYLQRQALLQKLERQNQEYLIRRAQLQELLPKVEREIQRLRRELKELGGE